MPPVLHTTLSQKWGGGIYSNTQFVLCIYSPSSTYMRSTITTTFVAFWKNGSFTECVQWELVLTLSREALKQLASSVVTGTTPCQLAFPVSNKDLGGRFCGYVFAKTIDYGGIPKAH